jgi:hypothetical protein
LTSHGAVSISIGLFDSAGEDAFALHSHDTAWFKTTALFRGIRSPLMMGQGYRICSLRGSEFVVGLGGLAVNVEC